MSVFLYPEKELSLDSYPIYKKAYFGLHTIFFLDEQNNIYAPLSEKAGIESLNQFYKKHIIHLNFYPVYNGKSFSYKKGSEVDTYQYVLGIPNTIFKMFDLKKEIPEQIIFKEDLESLKKTCYQDIYADYNKKWYCDDFKLYAAKKGFFFLYDESKDFLKEHFLPIYFSQENMSPFFKDLLSSYSSKRLVIDFLNNETDTELLKFLERFDKFNLEEITYYFINHQYDRRIAEACSFSPYISTLVNATKRFLIAIINSLYDDYCLKELKIDTNKKSIFTPASIFENKSLYSYSSYNGEVFTNDNKTFFFNIADKNKLKNMIQDIKNLEKDIPPLLIYARLGYPYLGYKMIEDKINNNDLISLLPFKEITYDDAFLAYKRYSKDYTYSPFNTEHLLTYYTRSLLDYGIKYTEREDNNEKRITIRVFKCKRKGLLKEIFDNPTCSLYEHYYYQYCLENDLNDNPFIKEFLRILDKVSSYTACSYFFSSFSDTTLKETVDNLLTYFSLDKYIGRKEIYSLFDYIKQSLLIYVEDEIRKKALKEHDLLVLTTLDGIIKNEDNYEIESIYPYVDYGFSYCSFKKTYFSTPYICSSQKESLEKRGMFFKEQYEKYHPDEEDVRNKNQYIAEKLGLPSDVTCTLFINQDILPQIKYLDDISHLKQSIEPQCQEAFSFEIKELTPYSPYIIAEASKYGLHITDSFDDYIDKITEAIEKHQFYGALNIDRRYISSEFLPYLDMTVPKAIALLCSAISVDVSIDIHLANLEENLGDDETLNEILFNMKEKDYTILEKNYPLYLDLFRIYYLLATTYAIEVSKKIIPSLKDLPLRTHDKIEGLPYTYVYYGRNFNAYKQDGDNNYYFCSCDKQGIRKMIELFDAEIYDEVSPKTKIAYLLSAAGLPYHVIIDVLNNDFTRFNIDEVMNCLHFKEHICRRCVNINHPALFLFFYVLLPLKDGKNAEYVFIRNQMIKDGFYMTPFVDLANVHFDPNYHYHLEDYNDEMIPTYVSLTSGTPEKIFTSFILEENEMHNIIFDYLNLFKSDSQTKINLSTILNESYRINHSIFLAYYMNINKGFETLATYTLKTFPILYYKKYPNHEKLINGLLGFLTYLIEKMIDRYVQKEMMIGRK